MKQNKIVVLMILMFIISIILCSCSDNKPDDVRQEVWDGVKNYYKLITQKIDNDEKMTQEDHDKLFLFLTKYHPDTIETTKTEKILLYYISEMAKRKELMDLGITELNDYTQFNQAKEKLEEYFK